MVELATISAVNRVRSRRNTRKNARRNWKAIGFLKLEHLVIQFASVSTKKQQVDEHLRREPSKQQTIGI